ncbi:MAG: N-acetylmuramoyl-L-alanine amidase [Treponema sp.]|uniref:N-acetylmuramoyl-L-alanine amidase n=1 Tax=Treponema sp. TaxID=166 RepID=UPI00298E4ECD|nr:N-acetylmuramoyl-L-alanine amidase [Treponema sp.]MBR5934340.1 N-acetylmuramoyl-L-alanine amidase [Treponema sp.]
MLKKKYFLVLAVLFFFFTNAAASTASKNLLDEAKKNGISFYWDSLSNTGILEKNGQHITFRPDQNFVLLNSLKVSYVDPPVITNGVLEVTDSFLNEIDGFFDQKVSDENLKIGAIIIDPGHGGKDPGASMVHKINGKNVTVREKDVNLAVGNMLCSMLSKAYPDKRIIMTRTTDVFLTLQERTEIANSVKLKDNEAVIYISIHVNASLDKKAKGYEVWYLTPGYRRTVVDKNVNDNPQVRNLLNSMMEEEYTTESILIAKFIMDGMAAQVGTKTQSRGIKAEEWFVVKNSKMPSVLIELGFLTNYEEACCLNDKAYLQKSALGIYNGISAFVTHFELSRGFTGTK